MHSWRIFFTRRATSHATTSDFCANPAVWMSTSEGRSCAGIPPAVSMVNYDKWDKIDVSDDEDDRPRRANVTRLDGPSRVTFGGRSGRRRGRGDEGRPLGIGPRHHRHPRRGRRRRRRGRREGDGQHGLRQVRPHRRGRERRGGRPRVLRGRGARRPVRPERHRRRRRARVPTAPAPSTSPAPSAATDTAAATLAERTARFTANGGRDARSPGAPSGEDTCGVRIATRCASAPSPPRARARDVAVRCTSTRVEVAIMAPPKPGAVVVARCLLSDEWAHPVDPEPEDPDDDDDDARAFGDWEVCDWEPASLGGRRVVRVTARKRGMGMLTHWWRKATVGGAEIDPAQITARKPGKAEGGETGVGRSHGGVQAKSSRTGTHRGAPGMTRGGERERERERDVEKMGRERWRGSWIRHVSSRFGSASSAAKERR